MRAEVQRGAKHVCKECDCRFYDLQKTPAVCPRCHTAVEEKESYVALNSKKTREKHNTLYSVNSFAEIEDIDAEEALEDFSEEDFIEEVEELEESEEFEIVPIDK